MSCWIFLELSINAVLFLLIIEIGVKINTHAINILTHIIGIKI